ncbi:unnamed protein product [marine sediment metagenome]|uniref:Uncharacterized protein n=1 Tax=marine sediment metagenome TaxID=412755 RepID=X1M2B7_9ZZZZ
MKRPHNKRKAYFRQYYLAKIKPHRALKPPVDVYSCVFCGMMTTLARLRRDDFYTKIYIRAGRNYFKPEEQPTARNLLYAKQREYFKFMCDKVLDFLKLAINYGLITKEDIILKLDLQIIKEIPATRSLLNTAVTSCLNTLSYSDNNSLENCNNLKPIKSLGGVING